jgi:HK97 family phage major capsid protein
MKNRQKIIEAREKRVILVNQAREILERADAAARDMDTEELAQYNRIMDDVKKIKDNIDRLEAFDAATAGMDDPEQVPPGVLPGASGGKVGPRATTEYQNAFRSFLLNGTPSAALQVAPDTQGGYLMPSEQFVNRLIQKMDDLVFLRAWASTETLIGAKSIGIPTIENDPSDSDWTSEIGPISEDSSLSFGKRELSPQLLTKLVKISQRLLRNSTRDPELIVADRLAYKFAVTQEKAFLTGDGNNKPLGVFTASASGISTNRDVANGNTSTAVTFDGLKAAKWSLKAAYLKNAKWLFHRNGVEQIDKIKDTTNQYIWQPSTQVGAPDLLLSLPIAISEYVPNTFTTGKYVGILGDFSFYQIVDSLEFSIQRLVELYATTNQVGYIGRLESDGMPVLEEAFARVKLG